ncbi:alpha-N-acetylneuraminate alpha-2,8-sialyltransferase ST8SIA3-like [Diadema setosum]|uniref:alpha-N-acetylneuraminate alpha-2,8-sialyltransferase ST8SIA3-like n=1 Tax=Diadema setosum TaxID=31175 RepID=UPI003B3A891A
MVFRCNAAPIGKFAEDAGRKTNLTTFNPSIFVTRYNSLLQTDDLDRFNSDMRQYSGIIMMTCFGAAQSFNTCAESLEHRTFTDPKLTIAHPSEIVNLWNYWKSMKTLKRPSTGFLIVHESIQLCEETHLYGFWPFPLKLDSTVQRVPYHYFDTIVPSQAHGMNTEFSIFVQYHELGIIRIHTGKC